MTSETLLLGRITAVYGIKGWVKIYSYTQPVGQILDYVPWILKRDAEPRQEKLVEGRAHGKGVIARFEGCDTRNQAETLIGHEIWVARDVLPQLETGAYYWYQLEGMQVVNLEGESLGCIDHLMETGASDVMVIKGEASERLIPFVAGEIVKQVDLDGGQVIVDWAVDWML